MSPRQPARKPHTFAMAMGSWIAAPALLAVMATAGLAAAGASQLSAPAVAISSVSAQLNPALAEVRAALVNSRISKWKAPGPVRDDATSNAGSIARDLDSTLPALLADADAAPGSVAKAFAVYRNIEAVYDVLLRISETASLAAPDQESDQLAHALNTLEGARKGLGEQIFSASQSQERALAQTRAALAAAAAAAPTAQPAATPAHVVINDGPQAPAHKAKPKPKAKPAAKPAETPQTGAPAPQ